MRPKSEHGKKSLAETRAPMFIMYIDESGNTIPLSQKGTKFLVLTGCIIHEDKMPKIESEFRTIKNKYFQNSDIEIKSNFLRYANPDLKESSPLKLNDKEKYDDFEADITKFLKNIPVTLYSVVIDKKANEYWRFNELSLIKLYKQDGVLNGFGLKFFPDKTKKDLRFFEA